MQSDIIDNIKFFYLDIFVFFDFKNQKRLLVAFIIAICILVSFWDNNFIYISNYAIKVGINIKLSLYL